MGCMEWFSLIKDTVVAGAAVTGAVVAVKGLSAWRRQLHGQNEYDLARRILVSVLKYREAIQRVRHPAMLIEEQPQPEDNQRSTMTDEQVRHFGVSNAYQARWDKVLAERVNLDADLLEAEVLWEDDLNELFKAVFDLQGELYVDIKWHLQCRDPQTDQRSREAYQKQRDERREVMYDISGDDPDNYKCELFDAVEVIKTYLKPKLTTKSGNSRDA